MAKWQDILNIFKRAEFDIVKNTILEIEVKLNKELDEFDKVNIEPFVSQWTYAHQDKNIKPYKLLSCIIVESKFILNLVVIKKKPEIDELRLLCQDLLDYFNCYDVSVLEFNVSNNSTIKFQ